MKGYVAAVLLAIVVPTTLIALLVHSAVQSMGQFQ